METMSDLDTFQADARDTAQDLEEVAASLRVKGMNGAASICERAARYIYETLETS
jgi:hypothetical protein